MAEDQADKKDKPAGGLGVEVRQTFIVTINYFRFYFLRFDLFLFAFLATVAFYSFSFVTAFVLIAQGLGDIIGGNAGAVGTSLPLLPKLDSHLALDLGIVLLGAAATASMSMVYLSAKAAGSFGAGLVLRFQPQWDSLSLKQKKALVSTGKVATTFARLVMNSVSPMIVFFSGIFYLTVFNVYLALAVLVIGILALFIFIPVDNISSRLTANDFDINVSGDGLLDKKVSLRTHMSERLQVFIARRFIHSANLMVLFLAIAAAFLVLGPDRIVGLFNEQTVVVIVIFRHSMLSLNRFTLCLRMARKRLPDLLAVQDICRFGKLPSEEHTMEAVDDEDDDF